MCERNGAMDFTAENTAMAVLARAEQHLEGSGNETKDVGQTSEDELLPSLGTS